jgi:hypothetical protein
MQKSLEIKWIGYYFEADVLIRDWYFNTWVLNAKPVSKEVHSLTDIRKAIMDSINDNGYGAKSMLKASIRIYDLYEENVTKFNKEIFWKTNQEEWYNEIYQIEEY